MWSGLAIYFLIQAFGLTPNNTAVSVAVIHNNPLSFLIALKAESIKKFGVPNGSIEITSGKTEFREISENNRLASLFNTSARSGSISFNSKLFLINSTAKGFMSFKYIF